MSHMEKVHRLLDEGASDGTFPAAQAAVFHRGELVFFEHAGDAQDTTVFDLASLTKPMCTAALFMRLWADGKVDPKTRLSTLLPNAPQENVALCDLLLHRSGLPDFVPYFADAMREHPELLDPGCQRAVREEVRRQVIARVEKTAPVAPVGTSAVYSDVGFILLGEALAAAAELPLDELFDKWVAEPLGIGARFHRLSVFGTEDATNVAPTGRTRPRDPAPGQEGLWANMPCAPTRPGEVDDDNCFVLDGVAGHAGLFGTARDVGRFGVAVLEELSGKRHLNSPECWERALAPEPPSGRTMGFDTPTAPSSAGRFIGDSPPGAVGHLGFTGTSLWIDRARQLVVALVTNRTYNGRANTRIRDFRPRFHDAVVEALRLEAAQ